MNAASEATRSSPAGGIPAKGRSGSPAAAATPSARSASGITVPCAGTSGGSGVARRARSHGATRPSTSLAGIGRIPGSVIVHASAPGRVVPLTRCHSVPSHASQRRMAGHGAAGSQGASWTAISFSGVSIANAAAPT